MKAQKQLTAEELAEALWREESWRQVLSSLVICFFARGIYTPEVVSKTLATIGVEMPEDKLHQLGSKILKKKHNFKQREGFMIEKIRIPKRILETISPLGKIEEEFIRKALLWTAEEISESH